MWEHFQLQTGFSRIMDVLVCVRSERMGNMYLASPSEEHGDLEKRWGPSR